MTDRAKLNELGFDEDKFPIYSYNALLFYLAELGRGILDNTAEPFTLERFKTLAETFGVESNSYADMWVEIVGDCFYSLKRFKESPEKLTLESIEMVKEASGSHTLFDQIEKFILDKKAYSILITNGAGAAQNAITKIEKEQERKYREASEDVQAWEKNMQEAIKQLKLFQEKANTILDNSFPEKVFRPLLKDGFKFIVEDRIESICLKSAVVLLPVIKSWSALGAMANFDENKRKEKITQLIRPHLTTIIQDEIHSASQLWLPGVIRGENPEYEYIREEILHISEKIQREWEEVAESCEYIKSISVPLPSVNIGDINVVVDQSINLKGLTSMVGQTALAEVMTDLIKVIVVYMSGMITLFILDGIFTFGIATLIAVIVQIAIGLGLYKPKERNLNNIRSKSDLDKKRT